MSVKQPIRIVLLCLGAALFSLLLFSRSSFLYAFNPWVDSNASLTVGKAFIRGRVLYAEIFDQRGPYLYLFYGLASLLSSTTFAGVFLMEWLSFSLFLFLSYQIARLYVPQTAWVSILLFAAIIPSSASFVLGGSPEQLLLPVFAYALFSTLRFIRSDRSSGSASAALLINGALCGIVLWTKYSLLGIYLGYVLSIGISVIIRKQTKHLFQYAALFLAGLLIATLPWVVYFGVHHAIGDWINGYIFSNIMHYANAQNGFLPTVLSILANTGLTLISNLQYSQFIVLGLAWVSIQRKPAMCRLEKLSIWLAFVLLTVGIFIGGVHHLYYGLPLSVFAVFGMVALLHLAQTYQKKSDTARRLVAIGSIIVAVLFFATGFATSMNTPYLQAKREEYALFRFRDIMQESESPTLLNYGSLDLGLYTICNITPQTKYFCTLNLMSSEMTDAIDGYLRSGEVEYVVSVRGDLQDRFERYELIDSGYSILNENNGFVYLYRLKIIPPTQ